MLENPQIALQGSKGSIWNRSCMNFNIKTKKCRQKNPDKTYQKHNVDLQINDVKTKSGKACKELEALRAKIGPKFYRNLN